MDATKKRLKELQQEVRRVQRQKRKIVADEKKKIVRRSFDEKVAVEICRLCPGSTTEAEHYLNMKGCIRDDGRPWCRESVLQIVAATHVVVEPSAHSVPAHADGETESIESAAHSYLLNHNTIAWVKEQNEKKGVAPMMQTTLSKYETLKNEVFTKSKKSAVPKSKSGRYQWATAWAKAWDVKKGKLKCGSVLPLQQRREKVNSAPGDDFFANSFQN